VKFKLDENIGHSGADLLRASGHDVSTVREQGLEGAPDTLLFDKCADERRALITLDHDFGQVLRFSPQVSAGIAILELGPRPSLKAIVDRISDLLAMLKVQPLEGTLWIVEPGRVRIHLQKGDG
jgi:predicted nuclease of predicted toxin-antitoxin system